MAISLFGLDALLEDPAEDAIMPDMMDEYNMLGFWRLFVAGDDSWLWVGRVEPRRKDKQS